MMHHHTIDKLKTLRLSGMARALERQLEDPGQQELDFETRLGLLVDQEMIERENRRLNRLLKAAKLRTTACSEDIDYRPARGLERSQIASLVTCQWIQRRHNLIITGATGTGKTWLACALGQQACRNGLSVRYLRLSQLFEELTIAHGDGSWARRMARLAKTDLIILDDWGLKPITANQRSDLMDLIEDRHNIASTLIAGQLPVDHWHDYIGEPTLADAILDRLVNPAHRLTLSGDSLRKQHAPDLD